MKNKKIIIIGIILLIIIGVVTGVSIFSNSNDEKINNLQAIYDKLIASEQYAFLMEENENNKTIMAKKGDVTSIDQYSDDEGHLTSLIKDGNTYLIYHEREEYYVYRGNDIEQNILTDGLQDVLKKGDYAVGTEKVNGKKYTYQEYSGSTIFTAINSLNIVEENVKTKFYFDKKNNLVYLRTTYENSDELLKVELLDSVDNSLFEIPSHYAEND